jgi:hypothetical protein
MKFEKAIGEGIEIVNKGIFDNGDKNRAFTVNGKGPYSIHEIGLSTHPEFIRAYKALKNQKVRAAIAQNIIFLKDNDPKYADIEVKASGDIVITADNGREIIRL